MKNKKSSNAGFVGILALLISVAVIAFLMIKNMEVLKIGTPSTSTTVIEENGTSGGGLAPINAAKNAKSLIEQDNRRAVQKFD